MERKNNMHTTHSFTPVRKWILSRYLKFISIPIIFFLIATFQHVFFVTDTESLAYMFNKLLVQIMIFTFNMSIVYAISFTIVLIYSKIKKRHYDSFLAFQSIIHSRTRKLFWITLIGILILSKLH